MSNLLKVPDRKETETPTRQRTESFKRLRSSPGTQEETNTTKKSATVKNLTIGMERRDIGPLSLDELMKHFSLLIDSKNLAKKEDIDDLKLQMKEIKEENQKLKLEIAQLKEKVKFAERRVELVENLERKNTLIFRGIEEMKGTDSEIIKNFCHDILNVQLSDNEIEKLHKINIPNSNKSLLKVRFTNNRIVMNILKNTKKLKGTGFFIDRDYTWAVRNRRRKLFQYRKAILETDSSRKVMIRSDSLILDGKKYYWDEDEDDLKTEDGKTLRDVLPVPVSVLQLRQNNR
uniref:Endonuclease-reverse transcriptase n=1 Tax=Rhodnius prolixus TaxID=13249 RepID=T1I5T9_RHOPR